MHLTATEGNFRLGLWCAVFPRATDGAILASPRNPKTETSPFSIPLYGTHFAAPQPVGSVNPIRSPARLPGGQRPRCDPAQQGSKPSPRQMAPGQQPPVMVVRINQGLCEELLLALNSDLAVDALKHDAGARQGPTVNSRRCNLRMMFIYPNPERG